MSIVKVKKAPPVGQRPKCRYCHRELRPVYRYDEGRPWFRAAAARTAWDREHKFFTGHYGGYGDDKFCGLNCGYKFGVIAADNAYTITTCLG